MKSRSRSASGSPRDLVRLRAWRVDGPGDPPQVSLDEVGGKLNMDNGLFGDPGTPEKQPNAGSLKRSPSSPLVGPTLRSVSAALMSPIDEPPSGNTWSSAVGHASTGKSGRVIERLQGDIDRLTRDKLVWKARFEEAEKTNETLSTRNTFLMDRNSNLEQSHEANMRQLARKDRMIEESREDMRKERAKTVAAERAAQAAAQTEEEWREVAAKARALAQQKEHEYESIASCRHMDFDRQQNALNGLKNNLEGLIKDREVDKEAQRRLEIIAEQQSQTIKQLEELNRKLSATNQAYRAEIDNNLSGLLAHARQRSETIDNVVEDMHNARDKMRWVVNVQENVSGTG
ncbi:hypothetical protein UCRPC4_g01497 [Phaeomoniella chlamydospora]|uniref:SWI5-dependent HO expression protein 3 n=1 Tax=Phaeomoniella chlamydospora TaxID=158046 RepID=A0A0G2GT54_PHACM|nr:hypothetical protein UCRPC4_g01497 [Phaeomoniella chlamydospora]